METLFRKYKNLQYQQETVVGQFKLLFTCYNVRDNLKKLFSVHVFFNQ